MNVALAEYIAALPRNTNRRVLVLRVIANILAHHSRHKAFAGEDHQRTRYYPEDDRYLSEKSDTVEHCDVVIDGLALSA